MPRWWTKLVSGGIGLALVVVPASVAQAQPNFADITASATVLSPLTVSWASDLDFGNVFPGVAAAVAITDGGAGGWTVAGATGAEVTLTFTLPANLVSGGNNLPIAFAAGDAGHNTANDPTTATTFDPAGVETTNLSGGAPGELWVWIGGTVTPAVNQPAGLYQNTVTLTVDYTGL
jgi:hypothetical protein